MIAPTRPPRRHCPAAGLFYLDESTRTVVIVNLRSSDFSPVFNLKVTRRYFDGLKARLFVPIPRKRNVQFSVDELIAISNVVNEAMGWVGEQDCETRLGVTLQNLPFKLFVQ